MQLSQVPAKFPIPWGNSAAGSYIRPIPVSSQIGIQAGAASLTDGFPPLNFLPPGAGGVPPFGQDYNGIFNQVTAWLRWFSAGGPTYFDGTYATEIGGYPKGTILRSAVVLDDQWISQVDNNTTDPDSSSSANWVAYGAASGDIEWAAATSNKTYWVRANGNTIGNAASGASERTNADTQLLFIWLWTNFTDTQCPVSGGRGASAIADFNASKTITLLDMRGTGVFGVDTMGGGVTSRLTGVPVTFGSLTLPGSIVGENTHTLTTPQIPSHTHTAVVTDPGHTHTYSYPGAVSVGTGSAPVNAYGIVTTNTSFNYTGISVANNNTGGGGAHNTVPLSMLGDWLLKL